MIRKLKSGTYRLYSRKLDPRTGKRRNLGTFATRAKAEQHERASIFNHHKSAASAVRSAASLRELSAAAASAVVDAGSS